MLNSEPPAVKPLEECAFAAKYRVANLMVWLMKLNEVGPATNEKYTVASSKSEQPERDEFQVTIKVQAAVISAFIEMAKRWEQRIEAVKSAVKKRRADVIEGVSDETGVRSQADEEKEEEGAND